MSTKTPQTKPLIRVEVAVRLLDVHPITLVRWAERGQVELIKLPNGRHRITEDELARLMAGGAPVEEQTE